MSRFAAGALAATAVGLVLILAAIGEAIALATAEDLDLEDPAPPTQKEN